MTNQEVLEKAIKLAIDGGWDAYGWKKFVPASAYGVFYGFANPDDDTAMDLQINDIIYNHDFAKALWGGCKFCNPSAGRFTKDHPNHWHYHLQQMVIADDPIKYLSENLPGAKHD